MMVVRIELWPNGDEKRARSIGAMLITNDNTGTPSRGNYNVTVLHGGKHTGKPGIWKKGKVQHFIRTLSPYHLVSRALAACQIH